jgi:hypothetical protein
MQGTSIILRIAGLHHPRGSMLRKEFLHLTADSAETGATLVHEADLAAAVYQESHGQSENATIHLAQLFVSHHDWVIQPISVICGAHQLRVVIHGDAKDLQPPLSICLLPHNEMWHLDETWTAPRRPKIQQDDLSTISPQAYLTLIQVRARKVWSCARNDSSGIVRNSDGIVL